MKKNGIIKSIKKMFMRDERSKIVSRLLIEQRITIDEAMILLTPVDITIEVNNSGMNSGLFYKDFLGRDE